MSSLKANAVVRQAVEALQAGTPLNFGGLTVLPLLGRGLADPDWISLEDGISTGAVTVTEVGDGGLVPTLQVTNKGQQPVLLLDGAELIGAKQNRILNTTVLVAAGQSVRIPVSCVEQGRWAYRSRSFGTSDRSLYASARMKKAGRVHDSLRMSGLHASDQGEIWSDLADKAEAFNVSSPTQAMGEVFESRKGSLGQYRQALECRPSQVGAIIWGGATWWGLEILPGPRLFGQAWPRLLSGYAMDALHARGAASPVEGDVSVLPRILESPAETFPGVGIGKEYRFLDEQVIGGALVVDDILAHLMAFPARR